MPKLLSIIIPSYNMEAYLRTCLESLCAQDKALFSRLDVLVVNDGSKDATSAIAHEFAARHPSVFRVIDKPNGHYGSCINRALPEATGEFVKILDADDMFDTDGLSQLLSALDDLIARHASVDLIWTNVRTTDENRVETGLSRFSIAPDAPLTLDDLTAMPQDRCMHAAAYRQTIFDGLGYHQSEGVAYTDAEWMFLPMTAVKTARYLPFTLYCYMLGRADQSMNARVIGKQLAMLRHVFITRLDAYCQRRATWSPMALRYAQSELSRAATCLYRTHLQAGVFGNWKVLRDIDRRIAADIPELLPRIGETDVLFPGKPYAISYGKLCARHPLSRPLLSLALRLKQSLAR